MRDVGVKIQVLPSTEPLAYIILMGGLSAAAKSRSRVKKVHQQKLRPFDIPMSAV